TNPRRTVSAVGGGHHSDRGNSSESRALNSMGLREGRVVSRQAQARNNGRLSDGHYPEGARGTGDSVADRRTGSATDSGVGNPCLARSERARFHRDDRPPGNAGVVAHAGRSPCTSAFAVPSGTDRGLARKE